MKIHSPDVRPGHSFVCPRSCEEPLEAPELTRVQKYFSAALTAIYLGITAFAAYDSVRSQDAAPLAIDSKKSSADPGSSVENR